MTEKKKNRLSEVYPLVFETMQEFRRNNTKLFFGVSGIILAILGWVITTEKVLSQKHQWLISIGISVVTILYLVLARSMRKHFLQAAKIVNRIDKIYGFYKEDEYLEKDILFPKEWEVFGTKKWKEPMFRISNVGVIILAVFTILGIWIF